MMILLVLIPAVLAIWGEYRKSRWQVYIFKPLTTLLIIWIALNGPLDPVVNYNWLYKWLIVVGLISCLGGDVFLMLPERFFIAGLVSFLIGHLFYIAAFVGDGGFHLALGWLLPLVVYGLVVYWLLHAHLGKMRGPVIVYVLAILTMAWQGLGRWSALNTPGAMAAAAGALFFVISDSTLALDRFRQKFISARLIVLSTYWAAQFLIAYSVVAV